MSISRVRCAEKTRVHKYRRNELNVRFCNSIYLLPAP